MTDNPDVFTDREIRNRILGMTGINDSNIQNGITLWRRIYEWSVGAGAVIDNFLKM